MAMNENIWEFVINAILNLNFYKYWPLIRLWLYNNIEEVIFVMGFMVISILITIFSGKILRGLIIKLYSNLKINSKLWRTNRIILGFSVFINWLFLLFLLVSVDLYNNKWDKITSFLSMSMFFLLANWLIPILSAWLVRHENWVNSSLKPFVPKILHWLLIIIAFSSYLDLFGIKILPIIAGLGFMGLAIALAAQDMVRNWLAGVLIITEKPFGVGDKIKVEEVANGRVDNIGFRATKIIGTDKQWSLVPNSLILSKSLINETRMKQREIELVLTLDAMAAAKHLQYLRNFVNELVQKDQRLDKHEEWKIYLGHLHRGIEFKIQVFTTNNDWHIWNETKFDLASAIMAKCSELKIPFSPIQ